MLRSIRGLLAAASIPLLLAGCAEYQKQQQLQDVAKDWSMVIRASQVIPVYPLTEDIQPGDIFLVQTPIDEQQKEYTKKGFLPLDNHIYRLNPQGYASFYDHSFQIGTDSTKLPLSFLKPTAPATQPWQYAPEAAFPSYTFSVKSGQGFNGALPLDGVPISLSLMGTDSADGSVTIGKARTYGVDMFSLNSEIEAWSARPEIRDFLSNYAPDPNTKQSNYVRVVSRVYVTGRLIVSLTDTSAGNAALSAGAPKTLSLLTPSTQPSPTSQATAADYAANLSNLNTTLSSLSKTATNTLPGATVSVISASANSITTSEDFLDHPLVLGYLGFDCEILKDGFLGPPIPTHARLLGTVTNMTPGTRFTGAQEDTISLLRQIRSSPRAADAYQYVVSELDKSNDGRGILQQYQAEPKIGDGRNAFTDVTEKFLDNDSSDNGPLHQLFEAALKDAVVNVVGESPKP